MTLICGGAMFGYIETGSSRNAASPAITMNAETTVANNGRSMKKFEITARCSARYSVRCSAAIGTAFTGTPGQDLEDSVDDDAAAGCETRRHGDVVTGERTELDRRRRRVARRRRRSTRTRLARRA